MLVCLMLGTILFLDSGQTSSDGLGDFILAAEACKGQTDTHQGTDTPLEAVRWLLQRACEGKMSFPTCGSQLEFVH